MSCNKDSDSLKTGDERRGCWDTPVYCLEEVSEPLPGEGTLRHGPVVTPDGRGSVVHLARQELELQVELRSPSRVLSEGRRTMSSQLSGRQHQRVHLQIPGAGDRST